MIINITLLLADHAQCIQHNFTLLQEELPGTDIATVTMERYSINRISVT